MKVRTVGTVICYNFSEEKYSLTDNVCRKLGIRIKRPIKTAFSETVGNMAGLVYDLNSDEPLHELPDESTSFEEEMMVMHNISGTSLDKFLKSLRDSGVDVPLKAVVTDTNKNWLPKDLAKEISKEHEMLAGK